MTGSRSSSGPDAARPAPLSTGLRDVVAHWLAEHPEGLICALDARGAPVDMPEGVRVGPGHQEDQRSLLELVLPADCRGVTDAFVDALKRGVGVARVHLASNPAQAMLLQYFDLRDDGDVVLRLLVPAESSHSARPEPIRASSLVSVRPRLAVVTKSEVAAIISIDGATTRMLGWAADEMVGRSTLEFIHPDDHVRAIDNWMSRLADRHAPTLQTVRLRYLCKDGTWLWIENSNDFQVGEDDISVVVCQMIDVSEEMAAVDALRQNEQFLRRLAETVPVGLFHVDSGRRVGFLNPVMQQMLRGVSIGSVADLAAAMSLGDGALLEAAVSAVLADGRDADLDVSLASTGSQPHSQCRVTLRAVGAEGSVIGVLGCVVDVTELKTMADTDGLTGLHNRRAIMDILSVDLIASDGQVSVIFVDLDCFKPINDSHGHRAGDQLLIAVGERLRSVLRPTDYIGRLGGDEFLIVCPGPSTPEEALGVAHRLRQALHPEFQLDQQLSVLVAASFGVACATPGMTADDIVLLADAAMYQAKKAGDGQPVLSAPNRAPG